MARFTKNAMLEYLHKRALNIRDQYKFDLNNGTSQLEKRSQADVLAYGEMSTCLWLAEQIAGGYITE